MIKGINIVLYDKKRVGEDSLGTSIYEEVPEVISNVLVAPTSEQDVSDSVNLTGRLAIYTLAIPKGDTHNWENRTVEFFGQKWRTVGMPTKGIDAMIPMGWNTKVRVERYE